MDRKLQDAMTEWHEALELLHNHITLLEQAHQQIYDAKRLITAITKDFSL